VPCSRAGNYSEPEQWLPPIRIVREAVLRVGRWGVKRRWQQLRALFK